MSLKSDANDIGFIQSTPGWTVYRKKLQEEYHRFYDKLLDCPSEDVNNIRGITKGLKMALDLPDIIKSRGDING